jgi:alkylation response protein AidB-like acyl-CoA dehydrogenase
LRVRVSAADALLHAAAELEGGDPASAKMAKQFAAAVGMQVAEEAVQLHGGIAVTAEHPTHLFLKRALLNQQLGDGPDREEVAIARALVASY